MQKIRLAYSIIAIVTVSACSSVTSNSVLLNAARSNAFVEYAHATNAPLIYLTGQFSFGAGLLAFEQTNLEQPVLKVSLTTPGEIDVDNNGDLYVPETQLGNIVVFHYGATSPYRTITGLQLPTTVAVDNSGNVYANAEDSNVIYFTPNGASSPSFTLTANFRGTTTSLAVDAAQDVFAACFTCDEVDEFPAGSETLIVLGTDFVNPIDLAVDSSQDLAVLSQDRFQLEVFSPSNFEKPLRTGFLDGPFISLSSDDSQVWTIRNVRTMVAQFRRYDYATLKGVRHSNSNLGHSHISGMAVSPASPI